MLLPSVSASEVATFAQRPRYDVRVESDFGRFESAQIPVPQGAEPAQTSHVASNRYTICGKAWFLLGISPLQIPAPSSFGDQRSHLGQPDGVEKKRTALHMLQKWSAVHYRLRPTRSRSDTLQLYGRRDLPPAEASGGGRTTRTDFGTARWLSDGPIDLSNRRRGRKLGRRLQTGTVCSARRIPCLGS